MIKVSSNVKLNMAVINQLSDAAVTALEQTAETLHDEVERAKVIPRRDGALSGESFFIDKSESHNGKVSLIHAEPYARRLYFHPEYHFHTKPWEETIHHKDGSVSHLTHEGNPNAKGKWFEDWEEGGKYEDYCKSAFERIYRRIADL